MTMSHFRSTLSLAIIPLLLHARCNSFSHLTKSQHYFTGYNFNLRILLFLLHRQATGVIFILVSQALAFPKVFKKSKCHQKSGDKEVLDYLHSMIFMTSAAVAMAILIIYGFNPPYKRLQMEQRKEAQKILQAGAEQRLPSIPNPSDPDIKNLC